MVEMAKRIMGVFKAASKPFESRERVLPWRGAGGREVYPLRVRLEPVVLGEKPLMFDELVHGFLVLRQKI